MTVGAKFADDFNMAVFVVYVPELFKENCFLQSICYRHNKNIYFVNRIKNWRNFFIIL